MQFIDLGRQRDAIRSDLDERIAKVISDGKYILGPEVSELEKRLAEYCNVRHCIGVANGTDALHMALRALSIGEGDAVFVPSFTFVASAEVIPLVGAKSVFVDVDPITFNMDPADLERKIGLVKSNSSHRPAAVMPVDLFGLPADHERIAEVASKHAMTVIEDAAQSFGGSVRDRQTCSFGQVATTSFFPAKPLGCYGDGGAIFTSDDEMASTLRSIRVHGKGEHKYDNVRIGLNSRLDTLQAAILLSKLEVFDDEMEKRQTVAAHYTRRLIEKFATPAVPDDSRSAWAQYTLRVPAKHRDALRSWAAEANIPTGIYYPRPIHLQPAYCDDLLIDPDCPVSEQLCHEVFSLPMHPYLMPEEIDQICDRLLAWTP